MLTKRFKNQIEVKKKPQNSFLEFDQNLYHAEKPGNEVFDSQSTYQKTDYVMTDNSYGAGQLDGEVEEVIPFSDLFDTDSMEIVKINTVHQDGLIVSRNVRRKQSGKRFSFEYSDDECFESNAKLEKNHFKEHVIADLNAIATTGRKNTSLSAGLQSEIDSFQRYRVKALEILAAENDDDVAHGPLDSEDVMLFKNPIKFEQIFGGQNKGIETDDDSRKNLIDINHSRISSNITQIASSKNRSNSSYNIANSSTNINNNSSTTTDHILNNIDNMCDADDTNNKTPSSMSTTVTSNHQDLDSDILPRSSSFCFDQNSSTSDAMRKSKKRSGSIQRLFKRGNSDVVKYSKGSHFNIFILQLLLLVINTIF